MTKLSTIKRNDALFDSWSIVHILTGIAMAWLMSPAIAFVLMVLWEPLEVLVLSPILARFGIVFGFESIKNSLSDIVFDLVGVVIGAYGLRIIIDPPFQFI